MLSLEMYVKMYTKLPTLIGQFKKLFFVKTANIISMYLVYQHLKSLNAQHVKFIRLTMFDIRIVYDFIAENRRLNRIKFISTSSRQPLDGQEMTDRNINVTF